MIKRFQAQTGFIVPLLTNKVYEFTPGFNVLFGQNGCLAEGTLVATPTGPIPIEKLNPGDLVFDENGNPIEVEAVIDQGEKEVIELIHRKKVVAESTKDHVWWAREFRQKEYSEIRTEDFYAKTYIKKVPYVSQMGTKNEPNAYVVAALLGDGCSVQRTNQIHISGNDEEIVSKMACILESDYRKLNSSSTWEIISDHFDHYIDWCRGRKAHQKIADIEELKTWNRDSLLWFLAGIIDTDGSVYQEENKPNTLLLNVTMQAIGVLEAVQYIIHALFGVYLPIREDPRNDDGYYVNGPCYYIKCTNHHDVVRIISEIGDRIQVPRKNIKFYSFENRKRNADDFISVTFGNTRIAHTWDIRVKSETSLYLLANGMVTHNSGKSTMLNTIKAYCGIQKGGWSQINDPRTHAANNQAHFPFAYTAYTPMPNQVRAFVDRDCNPAFYFHGDTKIDLNFMWDTSRQSENGILSGMDNLELAAKKPSSGMLKIELINRIMQMLQQPPNLNTVPEWIIQKESAMHEVRYIQSLPNYGKIALLFDEPETALSVPKQHQLFDTLETLSKTFQIIIATHSPLILFRDNINLIELTDGYAKECKEIYRTLVKKDKK